MAQSRTPLLQVQELTVRRGDTTLLEDINWTIRPGEHWVVLGPNGCGKTSLLKSMLGYLSPTAGGFTLLGQTYGRTDWRELRFKVGIVTSALQASIPPAEPALETVISGKYAQLDLWAPITDGDRSAGRRLLTLLGIVALADRPWLYLSQGERQRVLIARALMAKPRVLILDEPCAGLDPVARAEFLEFVERVARRNDGPSLILVTHHVEEITPAFTHALGLRHGRVAASGTIEDVVNSRTLSLLFGTPMQVRSRDGRAIATVKLGPVARRPPRPHSRRR